MNLEIKHLAPYLPYGLKVIFDDKIIGILHGIGLPDLVFDLWVTETNDENKSVFKKWCLNDTKPVVRPLSDLTEEITHNGETFIPIRKIAFDFYGYGKEYVESEEFETYNNNGFYGIITKDKNNYIYLATRPDNDGDNYYFGNSIRAKEGEIYREQKVTAQYQLFQKLLEWNFDLFELLEKEMAINFNKIYCERT